MDPLWHKYPTLSSYQYCRNNPMRYVDPTGEEILDINGNKITHEEKIHKSFKMMRESLRTDLGDFKPLLSSKHMSDPDFPETTFNSELYRGYDNDEKYKNSIHLQIQTLIGNFYQRTNEGAEAWGSVRLGYGISGPVSQDEDLSKPFTLQFSATLVNSNNTIACGSDTQLFTIQTVDFETMQSYLSDHGLILYIDDRGDYRLREKDKNND